MEVIEEQVKLNGETFTKSEIKEVAQFCTLDPTDGLSHVLKSGNVEERLGSIIRRIPISLKIRASLPMQKALKANLFISRGDTQVVIAAPELRAAFDLYQGK